VESLEPFVSPKPETEGKKKSVDNGMAEGKRKGNTPSFKTSEGEKRRESPGTSLTGKRNIMPGEAKQQSRGKDGGREKRGQYSHLSKAEQQRRRIDGRWGSWKIAK